MKTMTKPRISDIAALANVSSMTVSRVFNDNAPVSPKTKKKILEIANKLNYRPNFLARGLKNGETKTIGVLCRYGSNPLWLKQVAVDCEIKGYVVTMSMLFTSLRSLIDSLEKMLSRGIEHVVLRCGYAPFVFESKLENILSSFKSVLLISNEEKDLEYDQIIWSREDASCEIAKYFASKGRQRPCGIFSETSFDYKGRPFLDQLKKERVSISEESIIKLPASSSDEYLKTFIALLEERFPKTKFNFDSVYCNNDFIALTLVSWLKKAGYRVPEDVAVVGFDGIEMSEFTDPPLATVDRLEKKLSSMIEQILFFRIENPELPPRKEKVSMQFIVRESAG